jgi:hypothetical protein
MGDPRACSRQPIASLQNLLAANPKRLLKQKDAGVLNQKFEMH